MTEAEAIPERGRRRGRGAGFLASGAGLVSIKLVNAVLGFATVTVFARFMAPETYGIYVLALTVAQFLAMPLQMGIPVLLTREIAVARAEGRPEVAAGVRAWTRRILLTGTAILAAGLIGGYGLIRWLDLPLFETFTWPLVILSVLLIPAIAEMKRVMGILNGHRKPAQSRMPDGVIRPGLLLAAGGIALWAGWIAQTGLLAAHLAAAVTAALFGWMLVRRAEGKRHSGPVETRSSEWWASLAPLTILAAAGTINTYADILMLGAMTSPAETAFYRIAVQIAALMLLVQVAVNAILGPHMAALNAKGDIDRMQGLAVQGSRIACGAALLGSIAFTALGPGGVSWLLGEEYRSVYPLVVVLAFGTAAASVFGGTIVMLNMTRREKSSATFAISTAIANVLLNLALIPFFGAVGAAGATVATSVAMQVLAWSRLRRDLGIRTDAFARRRT